MAVHDIQEATNIIQEMLRQAQRDNASPTPGLYPEPSRRTLHATPYLYGLSGTCLLIRKDIFEKVGMWDESFHSYLEDVDLALRMRKFGYKFVPCLTAAVTPTRTWAQVARWACISPCKT